MKVELIKFTPDPDLTCAAAALSCHSSISMGELLKKIDQEKMKKILNETIKKGHHSVIEHANFTFSICGVSRALTHQLVRHRIASYSQQSQRYVDLNEPCYIIPNSIKNNPKCKQKYYEFMKESWRLYNDLIKEKIPLEDARFVLPNATATNITITMNARELIHFFNLRCSNDAQWEIREMANTMREQVKKVAPIIFNSIQSK
jgi:thymidylate synthase (FAD)